MEELLNQPSVTFFTSLLFFSIFKKFVDIFPKVRELSWSSHLLFDLVFKKKYLTFYNINIGTCTFCMHASLHTLPRLAGIIFRILLLNSANHYHLIIFLLANMTLQLFVINLYAIFSSLHVQELTYFTFTFWVSPKIGKWWLIIKMFRKKVVWIFSLRCYARRLCVPSSSSQLWCRYWSTCFLAWPWSIWD